MLSMNYSKPEIERMQDALDQRGGSKKENVYDVIKHKKKKMRVAMVLDQRANSVADLAAVLAAQEALGAETQKSKDEEAKGRHDFQVQMMLDLAKEAENGALEEIRARRKELTEIEEKAERLGEPAEMSKTQIRRERTEMSLRERKMAFSTRHVNEATQKVKQTSGNLAPEQLEARVRELLPGFPTPKTTTSAPKRGSLRARIDRANTPVFSTEGIVVKWANQLDAEWAEAWPETVAHQAMGLTRHRAPNADQEAVLDVASFRSKQIKAYEARQGIVGSEEAGADAGLSHEERSQKTGLTKVRGEILNMVKEAVAKREAIAKRAAKNSYQSKQGRKVLAGRRV
jgi:small-conductance mechanosensitive channel